ncbi:retrovirus-related Pol polyprotein from type-1 retrotransposable element R2, partial [Clonorchis sinensis]
MKTIEVIKATEPTTDKIPLEDDAMKSGITHESQLPKCEPQHMGYEGRARLTKEIQVDLLEKVVVSHDAVVAWPIRLSSMCVFEQQNNESSHHDQEPGRPTSPYQTEQRVPATSPMPTVSMSLQLGNLAKSPLFNHGSGINIQTWVQFDNSSPECNLLVENRVSPVPLGELGVVSPTGTPKAKSSDKENVAKQWQVTTNSRVQTSTVNSTVGKTGVLDESKDDINNFSPVTDNVTQTQPSQMQPVVIREWFSGLESVPKQEGAPVNQTLLSSTESRKHDTPTLINEQKQALEKRQSEPPITQDGSLVEIIGSQIITREQTLQQAIGSVCAGPEPTNLIVGEVKVSDISVDQTKSVALQEIEKQVSGIGGLEQIQPQTNSGLSLQIMTNLDVTEDTQIELTAHVSRPKDTMMIQTPRLALAAESCKEPEVSQSDILPDQVEVNADSSAVKSKESQVEDDPVFTSQSGIEQMVTGQLNVLSSQNDHSESFVGKPEEASGGQQVEDQEEVPVELSEKQPVYDTEPFVGKPEEVSKGQQVEGHDEVRAELSEGPQLYGTEEPLGAIFTPSGHTYEKKLECSDTKFDESEVQSPRQSYEDHSGVRICTRIFRFNKALDGIPLPETKEEVWTTIPGVQPVLGEEVPGVIATVRQASEAGGESDHPKSGQSGMGSRKPTYEEHNYQLVTRHKLGFSGHVLVIAALFRMETTQGRNCLLLGWKLREETNQWSATLKNMAESSANDSLASKLLLSPDKQNHSTSMDWLGHRLQRVALIRLFPLTWINEVLAAGTTAFRCTHKVCITTLFGFNVLLTFDNVRYKTSGASAPVPTSTQERLVGLTCEECGKWCKSKAGLVAHHRVHDNDSVGTNVVAQLACADCSRLFPTKIGLSQHRRHAHPTQRNADKLSRVKHSGARWSQQESQSLLRLANNLYPSCETQTALFARLEQYFPGQSAISIKTRLRKTVSRRRRQLAHRMPANRKQIRRANYAAIQTLYHQRRKDAASAVLDGSWKDLYKGNCGPPPDAEQYWKQVLSAPKHVDSRPSRVIVPSDWSLIEPITGEEVGRTVRSMGNSSPGLDKLTPRMLRRFNANSCLVTHDARCARHNRIARELAERLRRPGHTVSEELSALTSTSFIKPDLTAVQDRRATVIDVSIVSDGRGVTVWNEKKQTYGADEFSLAIISALRAIGCDVDFLVHQPMIISYRGICFPQSAKAVIGLGLSKVTVSDLCLLAIVGSLPSPGSQIVEEEMEKEDRVHESIPGVPSTPDEEIQVDAGQTDEPDKGSDCIGPEENDVDARKQSHEDKLSQVATTSFESPSEQEINPQKPFIHQPEPDKNQEFTARPQTRDVEVDTGFIGASVAKDQLEGHEDSEWSHSLHHYRHRRRHHYRGLSDEKALRQTDLELPFGTNKRHYSTSRLKNGAVKPNSSKQRPTRPITATGVQEGVLSICEMCGTPRAPSELDCAEKVSLERPGFEDQSDDTSSTTRTLSETSELQKVTMTLLNTLTTTAELLRNQYKRQRIAMKRYKARKQRSNSREPRSDLAHSESKLIQDKDMSYVKNTSCAEPYSPTGQLFNSISCTKRQQLHGCLRNTGQKMNNTRVCSNDNEENHAVMRGWMNTECSTVRCGNPTLPPNRRRANLNAVDVEGNEYCENSSTTVDWRRRQTETKLLSSPTAENYVPQAMRYDSETHPKLYSACSANPCYSEHTDQHEVNKSIARTGARSRPTMAPNFSRGGLCQKSTEVNARPTVLLPDETCQHLPMSLTSTLDIPFPVETNRSKLSLSSTSKVNSMPVTDQAPTNYRCGFRTRVEKSIGENHHGNVAESHVVRGCLTSPSSCSKTVPSTLIDYWFERSSPRSVHQSEQLRTNQSTSVVDETESMSFSSSHVPSISETIPMAQGQMRGRHEDSDAAIPGDICDSESSSGLSTIGLGMQAQNSSAVFNAELSNLIQRTVPQSGNGNNQRILMIYGFINLIYRQIEKGLITRMVVVVAVTVFHVQFQDDRMDEQVRRECVCSSVAPKLAELLGDCSIQSNNNSPDDTSDPGSVSPEQQPYSGQTTQSNVEVRSLGEMPTNTHDIESTIRLDHTTQERIVSLPARYRITQAGFREHKEGGICCHWRYTEKGSHRRRTFSYPTTSRPFRLYPLPRSEHVKRVCTLCVTGQPHRQGLQIGDVGHIHSVCSGVLFTELFDCARGLVGFPTSEGTYTPSVVEEMCPKDNTSKNEPDSSQRSSPIPGDSVKMYRVPSSGPADLSSQMDISLDLQQEFNDQSRSRLSAQEDISPTFRTAVQMSRELRRIDTNTTTYYTSLENAMSALTGMETHEGLELCPSSPQVRVTPFSTITLYQTPPAYGEHDKTPTSFKDALETNEMNMTTQQIRLTLSDTVLGNSSPRNTQWLDAMPSRGSRIANDCLAVHLGCETPDKLITGLELKDTALATEQHRRQASLEVSTPELERISTRPASSRVWICSVDTTETNTVGISTSGLQSSGASYNLQHQQVVDESKTRLVNSFSRITETEECSVSRPMDSTMQVIQVTMSSSSGGSDVQLLNDSIPTEMHSSLNQSKSDSKCKEGPESVPCYRAYKLEQLDDDTSGYLTQPETYTALSPSEMVISSGPTTCQPSSRTADAIITQPNEHPALNHNPEDDAGARIHHGWSSKTVPVTTDKAKPGSEEGNYEKIPTEGGKEDNNERAAGTLPPPIPPKPNSTLTDGTNVQSPMNVEIRQEIIIHSPPLSPDFSVTVETDIQVTSPQPSGSVFYPPRPHEKRLSIKPSGAEKCEEGSANVECVDAFEVHEAGSAENTEAIANELHKDRETTTDQKATVTGVVQRTSECAEVVDQLREEQASTDQVVLVRSSSYIDHMKMDKEQSRRTLATPEKAIRQNTESEPDQMVGRSTNGLVTCRDRTSASEICLPDKVARISDTTTRGITETGFNDKDEPETVVFSTRLKSASGQPLGKVEEMQQPLTIEASDNRAQIGEESVRSGHENSDPKNRETLSPEIISDPIRPTMEGPLKVPETVKNHNPPRTAVNTELEMAEFPRELDSQLQDGPTASSFVGLEPNIRVQCDQSTPIDQEGKVRLPNMTINLISGNSEDESHGNKVTTMLTKNIEPLLEDVVAKETRTDARDLKAEVKTTEPIVEESIDIGRYDDAIHGLEVKIHVELNMKGRIEGTEPQTKKTTEMRWEAEKWWVDKTEQAVASTHGQLSKDEMAALEPSEVSKLEVLQHIEEADMMPMFANEGPTKGYPGMLETDDVVVIETQLVNELGCELDEQDQSELDEPAKRSREGPSVGKTEKDRQIESSMKPDIVLAPSQDAEGKSTKAGRASEGRDLANRAILINDLPGDQHTADATIEPSPITNDPGETELQKRPPTPLLRVTVKSTAVVDPGLPGPAKIDMSLVTQTMLTTCSDPTTYVPNNPPQEADGMYANSMSAHLEPSMEQVNDGQNRPVNIDLTMKIENDFALYRDGTATLASGGFEMNTKQFSEAGGNVKLSEVNNALKGEVTLPEPMGVHFGQLLPSPIKPTKAVHISGPQTAKTVTPLGSEYPRLNLETDSERPITLALAERDKQPIEDSQDSPVQLEKSLSLLPEHGSILSSAGRTFTDVSAGRHLLKGNYVVQWTSNDGIVMRSDCMEELDVTFRGKREGTSRVVDSANSTEHERPGETTLIIGPNIITKLPEKQQLDGTADQMGAFNTIKAQTRQEQTVCESAVAEERNLDGQTDQEITSPSLGATAVNERFQSEHEVETGIAVDTKEVEVLLNARYVQPPDCSADRSTTRAEIRVETQLLEVEENMAKMDVYVHLQEVPGNATHESGYGTGKTMEDHDRQTPTALDLTHSDKVGGTIETLTHEFDLTISHPTEDGKDGPSPRPEPALTGYLPMMNEQERSNSVIKEYTQVRGMTMEDLLARKVSTDGITQTVAVEKFPGRHIHEPCDETESLADEKISILLSMRMRNGRKPVRSSSTGANHVQHKWSSELSITTSSAAGSSISLPRFVDTGDAKGSRIRIFHLTKPPTEGSLDREYSRPTSPMEWSVTSTIHASNRTNSDSALPTSATGYKLAERSDTPIQLHRTKAKDGLMPSNHNVGGTNIPKESSNSNLPTPAGGANRLENSNGIGHSRPTTPVHITISQQIKRDGQVLRDERRSYLLDGSTEPQSVLSTTIGSDIRPNSPNEDSSTYESDGNQAKLARQITEKALNTAVTRLHSTTPTMASNTLSKGGKVSAEDGEISIAQVAKVMTEGNIHISSSADIGEQTRNPIIVSMGAVPQSSVQIGPTISELISTSPVPIERCPVGSTRHEKGANFSFRASIRLSSPMRGGTVSPANELLSRSTQISVEQETFYTGRQSSGVGTTSWMNNVTTVESESRKIEHEQRQLPGTMDIWFKAKTSLTVGPQTQTPSSPLIMPELSQGPNPQEIEPIHTTPLGLTGKQEISVEVQLPSQPSSPTTGERDNSGYDIQTTTKTSILVSSATGHVAHEQSVTIQGAAQPERIGGVRALQDDFRVQRDTSVDARAGFYSSIPASAKAIGKTEAGDLSKAPSPSSKPDTSFYPDRTDGLASLLDGGAPLEPSAAFSFLTSPQETSSPEPTIDLPEIASPLSGTNDRDQPKQRVLSEQQIATQHEDMTEGGYLGQQLPTGMKEGKTGEIMSATSQKHQLRVVSHADVLEDFVETADETTDKIKKVFSPRLELITEVFLETAEGVRLPIEAPVRTVQLAQRVFQPDNEDQLPAVEFKHQVIVGPVEVNGKMVQVEQKIDTHVTPGVTTQTTVTNAEVISTTEDKISPVTTIAGLSEERIPEEVPSPTTEAPADQTEGKQGTTETEEPTIPEPEGEIPEKTPPPVEEGQEEQRIPEEVLSPTTEAPADQTEGKQGTTETEEPTIPEPEGEIPEKTPPPVEEGQEEQRIPEEVLSPTTEALADQTEGKQGTTETEEPTIPEPEGEIPEKTPPPVEEGQEEQRIPEEVLSPTTEAPADQTEGKQGTTETEEPTIPEPEGEIPEKTPPPVEEGQEEQRIPEEVLSPTTEALADQTEGKQGTTETEEPTIPEPEGEIPEKTPPPVDVGQAEERDVQTPIEPGELAFSPISEQTIADSLLKEIPPAIDETAIVSERETEVGEQQQTQSQGQDKLQTFSTELTITMPSSITRTELHTPNLTLEITVKAVEQKQKDVIEPLEDRKDALSPETMGEIPVREVQETGGITFGTSVAKTSELERLMPKDQIEEAPEMLSTHVSRRTISAESEERVLQEDMTGNAGIQLLTQEQEKVDSYMISIDDVPSKRLGSTTDQLPDTLAAADTIPLTETTKERAQAGKRDGQSEENTIVMQIDTEAQQPTQLQREVSKSDEDVQLTEQPSTTHEGSEVEVQRPATQTLPATAVLENSTAEIDKEGLSAEVLQPEVQPNQTESHLPTVQELNEHRQVGESKLASEEHEEKSVTELTEEEMLRLRKKSANELPEQMKLASTEQDEGVKRDTPNRTDHQVTEQLSIVSHSREPGIERLEAAQQITITSSEPNAPDSAKKHITTEVILKIKEGESPEMSVTAIAGKAPEQMTQALEHLSRRTSPVPNEQLPGTERIDAQLEETSSGMENPPMSALVGEQTSSMKDLKAITQQEERDQEQLGQVAEADEHVVGMTVEAHQEGALIREDVTAPYAAEGNVQQSGRGLIAGLREMNIHDPRGTELDEQYAQIEAQKLASFGQTAASGVNEKVTELGGSVLHEPMWKQGEMQTAQTTDMKAQQVLEELLAYGGASLPDDTTIYMARQIASLSDPVRTELTGSAKERLKEPAGLEAERQKLDTVVHLTEAVDAVLQDTKERIMLELQKEISQSTGAPDGVTDELDTTQVVPGSQTEWLPERGRAEHEHIETAATSMDGMISLTNEERQKVVEDAKARLALAGDKLPTEERKELEAIIHMVQQLNDMDDTERIKLAAQLRGEITSKEATDLRAPSVSEIGAAESAEEAESQAKQLAESAVSPAEKLLAELLQIGGPIFADNTKMKMGEVITQMADTTRAELLMSVNQKLADPSLSLPDLFTAKLSTVAELIQRVDKAMLEAKEAFMKQLRSDASQHSSMATPKELVSVPSREDTVKVTTPITDSTQPDKEREKLELVNRLLTLTGRELLAFIDETTKRLDAQIRKHSDLETENMWDGLTLAEQIAKMTPEEREILAAKTREQLKQKTRSEPSDLTVETGLDLTARSMEKKSSYPYSSEPMVAPKRGAGVAPTPQRASVERRARSGRLQDDLDSLDRHFNTTMGRGRRVSHRQDSHRFTRAASRRYQKAQQVARILDAMILDTIHWWQNSTTGGDKAHN